MRHTLDCSLSGWEMLGGAGGTRFGTSSAITVPVALDYMRKVVPAYSSCFEFLVCLQKAYFEMSNHNDLWSEEVK